MFHVFISYVIFCVLPTNNNLPDFTLVIPRARLTLARLNDSKLLSSQAKSTSLVDENLLTLQSETRSLPLRRHRRTSFRSSAFSN